MIDEQLKEQASLYVAGALPATEAAQFETALRSSLELQLLVKQLRLSVDALVAALPRRTPPPTLRVRLLREIDQRAGAAAVVGAGGASTGSGFWWQALPWALAACLTFLCVVLASRSSSERQQRYALEAELTEKSARLEQSEKRVEEQRNEAQQQRNEFTQKILQQASEQLKQQTATEIRYLERVKQLQREKSEAAAARVAGNAATTPGTAAPEAPDTTLSPGVPGGASVVAVPIELNRPITTPETSFLGVMRPREGFTNAIGAVAWEAREQRGTLLIEQLLKPPADKDYQLWLFSDDGRVLSGGVVKMQADGRIVAAYSCSERVDVVTSFKLTLEKAGGVPAPGQGVLAMETN